jgi:hypothetical protein
VTRLAKRDVERLLQTYDDDPIAALGVALAKVLDVGDSTWQTLVDRAGFAPERATRLLVAEPSALDALARELNELRDLAGR